MNSLVFGSEVAHWQKHVIRVYRVLSGKRLSLIIEKLALEN